MKLPISAPRRFRLAAPRRWKAGFSLPVAIGVVGVVVGMAVLIAEIAAGQLRQTAADAAVHQVEAIVRGFVDPTISEETLELDAVPNPEIGAELERLTISGDIREISIWSRDGRIVYGKGTGAIQRGGHIGEVFSTDPAAQALAAFDFRRAYPALSDVKLVDTNGAMNTIASYANASQLAAPLGELREALRTKSKERRYLQAFRQRHFEFLAARVRKDDEWHHFWPARPPQGRLVFDRRNLREDYVICGEMWCIPLEKLMPRARAPVVEIAPC